MTRSTAPDKLWHELRKAACAHLQAELDYERCHGNDVSEQHKFEVLQFMISRRRAAINAIVAAEQAKEQP